MSALPFLAVGRLEDGVTLAYYMTEAEEEQDTQTRNIFKLLKAPMEKLTPNNMTRLLWHSGTVCFLKDGRGKLLYCVVTRNRDYPEMNAYELLNDLVQRVQELEGSSRTFRSDLEAGVEGPLNNQLKPVMRELLEAYTGQPIAPIQIEGRGWARPEACTRSLALLALFAVLIVVLYIFM